MSGSASDLKEYREIFHIMGISSQGDLDAILEKYQPGKEPAIAFKNLKRSLLLCWHPDSESRSKLIERRALLPFYELLSKLPITSVHKHVAKLNQIEYSEAIDTLPSSPSIAGDIRAEPIPSDEYQDTLLEFVQNAIEIELRSPYLLRTDEHEVTNALGTSATLREIDMGIMAERWKYKEVKKLKMPNPSSSKYCGCQNHNCEHIPDKVKAQFEATLEEEAQTRKDSLEAHKPLIEEAISTHEWSPRVRQCITPELLGELILRASIYHGDKPYETLKTEYGATFQFNHHDARIMANRIVPNLEKFDYWIQKICEDDLAASFFNETLNGQYGRLISGVDLFHIIDKLIHFDESINWSRIDSTLPDFKPPLSSFRDYPLRSIQNLLGTLYILNTKGMLLREMPEGKTRRACLGYNYPCPSHEERLDLFKETNITTTIGFQFFEGIMSIWTEKTSSQFKLVNRDAGAVGLPGRLDEDAKYILYVISQMPQLPSTRLSESLSKDSPILRLITSSCEKESGGRTRQPLGYSDVFAWVDSGRTLAELERRLDVFMADIITDGRTSWDSTIIKDGSPLLYMIMFSEKITIGIKNQFSAMSYYKPFISTEWGPHFDTVKLAIETYYTNPKSPAYFDDDIANAPLASAFLKHASFYENDKDVLTNLDCLFHIFYKLVPIAKTISESDPYRTATWAPETESIRYVTDFVKSLLPDREAREDQFQLRFKSVLTTRFPALCDINRSAPVCGAGAASGSSGSLVVSAGAGAGFASSAAPSHTLAIRASAGAGTGFASSAAPSHTLAIRASAGAGAGFGSSARALASASIFLAKQELAAYTGTRNEAQLWKIYDHINPMDVIKKFKSLLANLERREGRFLSSLTSARASRDLRLMVMAQLKAALSEAGEASLAAPKPDFPMLENISKERLLLTGEYKTTDVVASPASTNPPT